jgi:hypothetical protein
MFRSYDHLKGKYIPRKLTRLSADHLYVLQELTTIIYQLICCSHVNFRCIYFHLKMVVRPKHVADNFNKTVKNY